MQSAEHDVIVAYQQEYDDTLHRTTPLSEECIQAAKNHLNAFDDVAPLRVHDIPEILLERRNHDL